MWEMQKPFRNMKQPEESRENDELQVVCVVMNFIFCYNKGCRNNQTGRKPKIR